MLTSSVDLEAKIEYIEHIQTGLELLIDIFALQTPLHLSAEHGHEENVQLLLEFNASMFVRDSNGMTAYDIADKCGHEGCMTILKGAAGQFKLQNI